MFGSYHALKSLDESRSYGSKDAQVAADCMAFTSTVAKK